MKQLRSPYFVPRPALRLVARQNPRQHPRQVAAIAGLSAVWCGLWGSVSPANLLAGVLVAIGAYAAGFGPPTRRGIRLRPLGKLVWLVGVDLVKSTINVAVEVLTPTDRTTEAIVAVEIEPAGRAHFLCLVVAMTLTPGTAVIDADEDSGVLFLHLLHYRRHAETVAHVEELARLAADALSPAPRGMTA